jgi:hypothetical protein
MPQITAAGLPISIRYTDRQRNEYLAPVVAMEWTHTSTALDLSFWHVVDPDNPRQVIAVPADRVLQIEF